MSPTGGGGSLPISLAKTAADLINNPLHADVKIVSKNKTYHGHKIILYSRSKKWGCDKDLAGVSILNWTQWSDETIQDVLDYTYLDQVIFLEDEDGCYDDLRTIKLMSAATYFSLDNLVSKCELSLQKSKDRFILPRDSVSVLSAEALQISSKNFRPGLKATSRRSVLRINSIVKHKRARSVDTDNDHFYGFNKKKSKLEAVSVTRNENREAEALAISGFDLVTEQDGRYEFTAVPRTDQHVTVTADNRAVSGFSVSGSVLTSTTGRPVSGAHVTLTADGKKFTVVTDAKGSYQLESITSATYTITATSPGYEFSPVTAVVSPSSPVLPVVAASRYEVVGHLDYSTVAHDSARVMIISSRKGANVIATVDKTGKFSTMLPSENEHSLLHFKILF